MIHKLFLKSVFIVGAKKKPQIKKALDQCQKCYKIWSDQVSTIFKNVLLVFTKSRWLYVNIFQEPMAKEYKCFTRE